MVADREGVATPYALFHLQERGVLFVPAGTPVYEGMVVGEYSRDADLDVNVCREKKLSNMRAAGHDEAVRLVPHRAMGLEDGLEWIDEDELVEVTPDAIRLRKRELRQALRPRGPRAGRIGGAPAGRVLRTPAGGVPGCATATLLDGLVLARSAFHHSLNYRSVVILGTAAEVTDPAERLVALEAIVEHVVPGRWREVRGPSERELKLTKVLSLPIAEASAKVRTGGPLDDEEDLGWPCWAGVLPLDLVPLVPVPDARLAAGIAVPTVIAHYRRVPRAQVAHRLDSPLRDR